MIADFHRWEAVDGTRLSNEDLLRAGAIVEPLKAYSPGAIGCALSHRSLWEHCAAGEAAVTLCEDDAIFNRHFSRRAEAVLSGLPRDWDIILWGWNFDSILHVEVIEGLGQAVMHFAPARLGARAAEFQEKAHEILPLRLVMAFGTICYSVSRKGARSLLQRCFPLRNEVVFIPGLGRKILSFGIDSVMNKHYAALKSYVAFPPLVWTENDKSTSDAARSSATTASMRPVVETDTNPKRQRGFKVVASLTLRVSLQPGL